MSTCFLDTSAAYASFDRSDEFHGKAVNIWERLIAGSDVIVTSNYIIVETTALLQARLGLEAARGFLESVVPFIQVEWIDRQTHGEAALAYSLASRKALSLVDCTSFLVMKRLGIRDAFAFDRHFAAQGYRTLAR